MKRILSLLLILILVMSVAACKKNDTTDTDFEKLSEEIVQEDATDETEDSVADSADESDITEEAEQTEAEDTEYITEYITEEITTVPEEVVEIVGEQVAQTVDEVQVLGGADEMLSGVTDVIYANLSDAEKEEFVKEAKAEGLDVIFNDDGTTTIVYSDGSRATQQADGTFVVESEGFEGQIGGEWPSNDMTELIPKPEKGQLLTSEIIDGTFTAMLGDCTVNDAVDYAAKLIEKGFDDNVESDESMLETGVFTFRGENDDKNAVAVINYLSEIFIISITM